MRFEFPKLPTWEQVKNYQKSIYTQLARDDNAEELRFMNYGYIPDEGSDEAGLSLEPSEEKYRCQIQLYDHLARQVGLDGKNVLEVGCGRGGGASYCTRYLRPRSYTGLDLVHGAVLHGASTNSHGNLRFLVGDAESLPFLENVFDVVLNVESCHCYHPIEKFLEGVRRVLVPGGHLLLTDFRSLIGLDELRKALLSCRMNLLQEENISRNVFAAIKRESRGRMQAIVRLAPEETWAFLQEFGAVRGSVFYSALESGDAKYMSYVLQKT